MVIILILILSMVSTRYLLLRRELEFLTKEYQELDLTSNRRLKLRFQDKALEAFIVVVNRQQDRYCEMQAEVSRTERLLKEGITNISHDLRTPLTAVIGFNRLMRHEELSSEKAHEYLDIIERRAETLEILIGELFDFSRIESNEYHLELQVINLTEILGTCISEFYEEIIASGISPMISIPDEQIYINGDKLALNRILQNLVKNAITHGAGTLDIKLKTIGEVVQIRISNKVENFEADLNQLFERFYSPKVNGSGLGLYIAKQLAVKMNGNLTSELEEDELSFLLTFKLK